jgi:hypothetical protein
MLDYGLCETSYTRSILPEGNRLKENFYAAKSMMSPTSRPPTSYYRCSRLAEHINDSFYRVSTTPLYIIGTPTPDIVALSNTQQVVLLKLTNTNYLY